MRVEGVAVKLGSRFRLTAVISALVLAAGLPGGVVARVAPAAQTAPAAPTAQTATAAPAASASAGGQGGVTTSVGVAGGLSSVTTSASASAPYAPDRLIVKFRGAASLLPGTAGSRALVARSNVFLVKTPPGLSVAAAVARYQAMSNVVYAEPDYTVSVSATTPNDPLYAASQWDMGKISAPTAWDTHTDSSNVVVAIIDTGIDYTHPDLVGNLWSDPSNPSVHGYTCMNGACVAGGADDYGHGTHVAGTIGAVGNDAAGMAGINWHVKLLSMKFLGSSGSGSTSDATVAFQKLLAMKSAGVNIRVTNNSWGGGGYSQTLKDAMSDLEAAGVLDVCAAGNSGINADFSPMYPGAYDNRGIVSVLATDSNDLGAGFTNYGLASVDLAAPGVSTFSTVPTGTCTLCDPSGYKLLSGTSMASPHVAGVAAAMLSMHASLTAAQARDALLRPAHYDAMSDSKAAYTSTGGRLNFAKVLADAGFYTNPIVLNQFPTVTVGPDAWVTGGQSVSFSQTSSDPDGDTLRTTTGRGAVSAGSAWLFEYQANRLFPNASTFTAPSLARTAAMPYDTSVADGRGGGASGRNWAVVSASASHGGAPTGVLTVPATAAVGQTVTIGFTGSDPEKGPVTWDFFASSKGGSSGTCCFGGTSTSTSFSSAGVYRITVQAIDQELNLSPTYSAVIAVGGATGSPPIAAATLDVESGPAPLTVNIDMSASTDSDGTISTYFIGCGGGWTTGTSASKGTCTFTQPGTYWLLEQVQDNSGYMGLTSRYVVVTPTPPGGDTTAPTVSITNPASGATITGSVNLTASASDNAGGSGVKQVDYYLDNAGNAASLIGSATTSPYSVAWNPTSALNGAHTIWAIARDNAGNSSTAASAPVTVSIPQLVKPTITLAASASAIAKKGTVTFTATVGQGTYPIARVEFYQGTTLIGTDSSSASGWTWTWKAPAAPKTLTFTARVYDSQGNFTVSNSVTVKIG